MRRFAYKTLGGKVGSVATSCMLIGKLRLTQNSSKLASRAIASHFHSNLACLRVRPCLRQLAYIVQVGRPYRVEARYLALTQCRASYCTITWTQGIASKFALQLRISTAEKWLGIDTRSGVGPTTSFSGRYLRVYMRKLSVLQCLVPFQEI